MSVSERQEFLAETKDIVGITYLGARKSRSRARCVRIYVQISQANHLSAARCAIHAVQAQWTHVQGCRGHRNYRRLQGRTYGNLHALCHPKTHGKIRFLLKISRFRNDQVHFNLASILGAIPGPREFDFF